MKQARDLKRFQTRMRTKKHSTEAERLARSLLEQDGRNYKTQVIIGFYIVDFILPEKMLVVELDGEYHDTEYQKWYDQQRTIFLTKCKLKVLRLRNDQAANIIDEIAKYPNLVGWEKEFRHATGYANALKSKAIQEKRKKEKIKESGQLPLI